MKERFALFDMDGVLIDAEPLYKDFLFHHLQSMGVTDETVRSHSFTAVKSDMIWKNLRETHNLIHDVSELEARARQGYLDYLNTLAEIPAIPGAAEFARACHDRFDGVAIASSAGPKRIELFLAKLGIRDCFDVIIDGDSVEHSKPAPDCYLLAAKRLGAKPDECFVIEDAAKGVTAAKSAGMRRIGYAGSGRFSDELRHADVVVHDMNTLAENCNADKDLFDVAS